MIRFSMRALTISHFAIASALLASPALAQTATQAQTVADEPAPGEIVVTAAKRSENLQAVPISITAIGGDNLAKAKVDSVDSLVTKVVNLQLTSIVGDNTPIFALRGVSMSDYSLNQSSPVATYYDEVYKGNFAFLGVAMYDLERVEVLRGPQGTLYGKNTTGGAVNLISRTAKLGETSGYINAGYGITIAPNSMVRSICRWAKRRRCGLPAPSPMPTAGSRTWSRACPTLPRPANTACAAR